jgi:SpoVK/Ycf46/Vps4 family AAA+-type ATPase
MSNEIDDLQEFNSKVSGGDTSSTYPAVVRRSRRGEDPNDSSDATQVKDTRMWAVHGKRNYSPCEAAVPEMPPGQYTISASDSLGIYFSKTDINLDDLIKLPDSVSEQVIGEIESFWKKEEHFRKFGFLWKRGVLMWGPPGSGKTSTLQIISEKIIERGGISVYVDHPGLAAKGLKILRQIEPSRPLIVMLEDIDSIIDNYGESDLLALMDGELQIDNVVFVATTNYPEKLDKRFINRPSRFDIVKKIGMPNDDARELYLKTKCDRLAQDSNKEELLNWIQLSKGFSIAHLKELIVSVEVFEVDLDDAVTRLRTMMDYSPKSSDGDECKKLGFT